MQISFSNFNLEGSNRTKTTTFFNFGTELENLQIVFEDAIRETLKTKSIQSELEVTRIKDRQVIAKIGKEDEVLMIVNRYLSIKVDYVVIKCNLITDLYSLLEKVIKAQMLALTENSFLRTFVLDFLKAIGKRSQSRLEMINSIENFNDMYHASESNQVILATLIEKYSPLPMTIESIKAFLEFNVENLIIVSKFLMLFDDEFGFSAISC